MNHTRNVFVTGFPGFLGSSLVERLVRRHAPRATVTCLVEASRLEVAGERARELLRRLDKPAECLRVVEGDLARYDLGSAPDERRERETSDVFHLSSSSDPGAPRETAYRANVESTRHLLDMALRCPKLRRFHLLSTCYVSGRRDDLFSEDDFQVGQSFRNAFEETKFLAEVELRQRMREGLDATIYRTTLIVGDGSGDPGADQDGMQLLLPFLFRVASWSVSPVLGDPLRYRVNAVPRRFVADAIDYLASLPQSRARTYHLCDPSAPTVQDLLKLLQVAGGKKSVPLPLPPRIARWAVAHSAALRKRMGVTPELLDYVTSPTRYSSRYALRDLAPAHIACPPLVSYLPRLLADWTPGAGSPAVA